MRALAPMLNKAWGHYLNDRLRESNNTYITHMLHIFLHLLSDYTLNTMYGAIRNLAG